MSNNEVNGTSKEKCGNKIYELKDHLGNVRVTFTDVKQYDPTTSTYTASLGSVNNYYAFGGLQIPRTKGAESYKFGFNGQEMDNEIKGDGNSIEYKYRVHDPRLGRFLSIDPLSAKYPWNSPYAFCENRVIDGVELEGLEHVFYLLLYNKEKGLLEVQRFDELDATMNTVLGDFAPIQGDQAFVYGSDSHWHLIPEPLRKYSINNYSDDIDKNLEFVNSFPIADEAWDAKVKAEALVRIGNIANAGLGAGLLIAGAGHIYKAISAWKAAKTVTTEGKWIYGAFKSEAKWANQFAKRGWTPEQVSEAILKGKQFDAVNMVNKANSATRYVHPTIGRSVVIDNVTREILQVGGDGFLW